MVRISPAETAINYCGKLKRGNNGKLFLSKRNKNGICRWQNATNYFTSFLIEHIHDHVRDYIYGKPKHPLQVYGNPKWTVEKKKRGLQKLVEKALEKFKTKQQKELETIFKLAGSLGDSYWKVIEVDLIDPEGGYNYSQSQANTVMDIYQYLRNYRG
jgi:hypothetical protein